MHTDRHGWLTTVLNLDILTKAASGRHVGVEYAELVKQGK